MITNKAGSFKKMYKPDGMKRLSDFGGKREPVPLAPPTQPEPVQTVQVNQQEEQLAKQLGDEELAHRVTKIQEKHPFADALEALAIDWLDKNLAVYVYQAEVNGGYRPGGRVPDFVVDDGSTWTALLLNGNYWHRFPEKNQADKLAINGQYFNGKEIAATILVWESRMMRSKDSRDQVMAAAISRQELGP